MIFSGYLLGRVARSEPRKSNDMLTYNLTILAESIYKKAKRIPPKLIHQNEPQKIQLKLLDIFNCTQPCGELNKYNLAEFVRNSMNYQVNKLMKAVTNASIFLDSLSWPRQLEKLYSWPFSVTVANLKGDWPSTREIL